jgi:cytochrome b6-f complex iron-sulfur subunit
MCDEPRPLSVEVEPVCSPRPERRGFLRILTGAVVALVTFPAAWARAKKVGLKMASVGQLSSVGGSATVKVKGLDILLVRDGEDSVKAINSTCTHKKCQVKYKSESNDLFCKCHKSKFQLDGTVVSGPAPKPLATYPASMQGDQIVISLPD